jgi:hypothetical protein
MLKIIRELLAGAFAAVALASAAFAQDAEKLAATVPPEVSEIATAGTWNNGNLTGVFRAIVIMTPTPKSTQANLIVQLLAVGPDGVKTTVAKSIHVKKVAEKKLPNAFLAVEEDTTENEITWRLTSYDAQSDTDTGVLVSVNAKGETDVKDAPIPEELQGAKPDGEGAKKE